MRQAALRLPERWQSTAALMHWLSQPRLALGSTWLLVGLHPSFCAPHSQAQKRRSERELMAEPVCAVLSLYAMPALTLLGAALWRDSLAKQTAF